MLDGTDDSRRAFGARTLVCREAEMPDVLEEEGWHEYIEENGDRREYHGYGTWGSTNYYEHFVWEWGKGLVAYRSGYGAESYGIELHLK